jgi:hypothetical protein
VRRRRPRNAQHPESAWPAHFSSDGATVVPILVMPATGDAGTLVLSRPSAGCQFPCSASKLAETIVRGSGQRGILRAWRGVSDEETGRVMHDDAARV